MAGYSSTPLAKKLGIKEGCKVVVKNPPDRYADLVAPLPAGVKLNSRMSNDIDVLHVFVRARSELVRCLPIAMARIKQNGMIWVSWPKKAAGVATDVTEDVVRAVALPLGLVDVKVCAVDDIWSGLKLVIRRENRTQRPPNLHVRA